MGPFDAALMTLPKGRDLARRYFLACGRGAAAGGRFYLAGPNDGGIKSALKDAEALYGPGSLLAYKGGNRVTVFTRPPDGGGELPEMYRTPGVAEGTHHEFDITINDERFTIHSRPRRVLVARVRRRHARPARKSAVLSTDRVLDVGCGYGVVGLYAARRALKGEVTMVDADALAIACARETAAANGLEERVELLLGDGLQAVAGRRFTLIASNPPFHTGHAVNSEVAESFVRGAFDALEPRGRLVIVANRFLPYDRLMTELFGAVEALAQTPQYHVLCAEKVRERRARGKLTKASVQARDDEWMAQAKSLE
jgi:16S rRNA (guanine1207-N2)-methyltransferase